MFAFGPRARYASRRCLSRHDNHVDTIHRYLSSSEFAASYGNVHLTNRRLLLASGVDAAKFLQGLTTNNVDPTRTQGWYTAFLHAHGRVLYEGFIYPVHHKAAFPRLLTSLSGGNSHQGRENEEDWACLIDVDASEVESLMKHLKRHKLRSKVNFSVVDDGQLGVWAVQEPLKPQISDVIGLEDPRAPSFGYRLVTGPEHTARLGQSGDKVGTIDDYNFHRYRLGVPEGPLEIIRGQALPMESNIDLMGGIDFKKGCYIGQELTIRTAHTGIVRKRILPVELYPSGAIPSRELRPTRQSDLPIPPAGTDITSVQKDAAAAAAEMKSSVPRRRARANAAGTFLNGIGNIGLALCRLETMTDVRLTAEGGGWSPNDEFQMDWSSNDDVPHRIQAKAYLPEWHKARERLRPQKKSTAAPV